MPRVPRRVRRRRRVREQGVPVHRDGAPRGRGGPRPRRRDRRRAARRTARRVSRRSHRVPRQQQVRRPSCGARSTPGSVGSWSTRSTSSTASSASRRHDRPRCTCASPPASRRTRTSSSRPAPKTRSSGSGSTTATRSKRSRACVGARRLRSSRASTATSARRCSGRLRSRARSRRWSASFAPIEAETGATVDELNVGGGLGVRYLATDDPPTIAQYAALRARSVRQGPRGGRSAVPARC